MRPTVVFDGSCLGAVRATGVERSFVLTLTAFAQQRDVRCVAFHPRKVGVALPGGIEWREMPRLPMCAWRRNVLPRELTRIGADLLLSPTTALPVDAPCPCVATVHELPGLYEGAEEHALYGLRQDLARERLAARAWRVLVPSAHTQRDLARHHPELAARTRIVFQPLDPRFLAAPVAPAGGHGFVFVGQARRRKNLARLFAAYAELPSASRTAHPLLWVGGERQRWPCPLPEGTVRLPHLPVRDLVELLHGSRAVLLPSLSEGFGLPALEGLALGLPALGRAGSVTEELCGDLAVHVDPYDIAALTAGLVRLLEDDALRERARCAGPSRARRFTPARSAAGWRELLPAITAGHPGEES